MAINLNPDNRLPIIWTPSHGVLCAYCGCALPVLAEEVATRRMLVEHGTPHPMILEQDYPVEFCLNNGKSWVIELYQPKIYLVDVVTGEIDTFGGMV